MNNETWKKMCALIVILSVKILILSFPQIYIQSFAQGNCDPNAQSCPEPPPVYACDPNTESCT